ncbi:metal-dependent transcriptional regulator [Methanolobus sp. ZRKC2]|uniref:metal-dependent transcriptional regulator n=1 Tax=Methanolobus sp. ZRKC2 TaxID=3125783 RepID=UPI00324894A2
MTTERTEDYLKMLDSIIEKKGYAKVKDVSEIMNLNPSTVTGMFKKLDKEGYINYEKYGAVTLTSRGKEVACRTEEKYDVVKDFLLTFGLDTKTAEEDACKIEHAISPKTLKMLSRLTEFVTKDEDLPQWLNNFKFFYETGVYTRHAPEDKDDPLTHEKKEN